MWSSTNQRIKALMSARAREKDRLTRPIHVRRAEVLFGFLAEDGKPVEVQARALLNDFSLAGFSAYALTPLTPNAEISVEIAHPKKFHLTGKVVWCQYQPSSSHVLTANSFSYRVGIALIWKDAALEAEFKKYCIDLEKLYVNSKALFLESAMEATPSPTAAPSADPAAAVAAVADEALKAANPETPAAPAAETPATPAAEVAEEKKAA